MVEGGKNGRGRPVEPAGDVGDLQELVVGAVMVNWTKLLLAL